MKKELHIVTAPVKSQTTIIMNPRFQLSTLSRTKIENVGHIKYVKCSMFQRQKQTLEFLELGPGEYQN